MADKNIEAQISVEFEEATSRQSLNSGETINTLWGKVKRWLSDLKAVAFSGSYSDLSDKPTISNPNLLINPDFKINQRGLTTYSGTAAYSVDHWFRNSEATMNIAENGITLTYSGTSNPSVFQRIENTKLLLGKTLTFSARINGAVYSCTNILPDSFSGTATYFAFARLDGSTSMPDNSVPHIRMQILTGLNLICVLNNVSGCEWAKLEIGSTATPYSPPDPATELIKCQRYYQIRSTNNIAAVDLRPNMREGVTPTVTALSGGNYSYSAEL